MTSSSIITLINNEQDALARKKQTALARGKWQLAADCETKNAALQAVKFAIVAQEELEVKAQQAGIQPV